MLSYAIASQRRGNGKKTLRQRTLLWCSGTQGVLF
jgi:hypothetical protein